jgi:acyl-coenzyme A synthetase/AMP-(fatty) acid ligase
MPDVRWFAGAQLNYAAQVVRHARQPGAGAGVSATNGCSAKAAVVEIGWAELADQVAALAATLRALGVQRGDRVAAYLPNVPQAAVAFLACASIGAIWSLTAPDMGVGTVRDRFRQIDPVVLIACDGSVYGGKVNDRRSTAVELLQRTAHRAHAAVGAGAGRRRRNGRALRWTPAPGRAACWTGPTRWPAASAWRPSRCPSNTRCGSSTAAAPPACPSPSCTATAAWCWRC